MQRNYICCFGEVLWDDFPSGRLPGGAPMNVAIGLQNLGVPSRMISRVGNDPLGRDLKIFIESKNCSTAWIQTDNTYSTGIVKVNASLTGENHYDIIESVAWDRIDYTDDLSELVANAYATVYGTLACRQQHNLNTLIQLLTTASLKVYDVNFRPPFYNQELVESLMTQADIVKMNDDELNIVASWYGWAENAQTNQIRLLKDKFNLKILVITRGANGAICIDNKGIYESAGFKVQVQDTVGSGDAFLAGFLKSLYQGHALEHALTYACALGALVAAHKGANPNITEKDITALQTNNNNHLFGI